MKYFGAFLVFCACAGAGAYRAALIRRRARTLAALCSALELLRGEIAGRLSDLPSALGTLSRSSPDPAKRFFADLYAGRGRIGETPFAEIWRECAENDLAVLTQDELARLMDLGAVLGRYDADTQAAAIEGARAGLARECAAAESAESGNVRAALGAGSALGLIVAIALI